MLLAQVEELARQLPVMVVEGNHERDWPQSDDRFLDSAWDSGMPPLTNNVENQEALLKSKTPSVM